MCGKRHQHLFAVMWLLILRDSNSTRGKKLIFLFFFWKIEVGSSEVFLLLWETHGFLWHFYDSSSLSDHPSFMWILLVYSSIILNCMNLKSLKIIKPHCIFYGEQYIWVFVSRAFDTKWAAPHITDMSLNGLVTRIWIFTLKLQCVNLGFLGSSLLYRVLYRLQWIFKEVLCTVWPLIKHLRSNWWRLNNL